MSEQVADEHGLKINRLAISPNGTRVAVQFEGFAHFLILRGDRAKGRDSGDFDTFTDHATADQLKGWIRVNPDWSGGKVVDTLLRHEPVEPHVEAFRRGLPPVEPGIEPIDARPSLKAATAESPMAPDTVTLPLREGPALVYLDADGADRLDAGPLLESGPGGFGERVASPRRLALIGALLTLAGKRLTAKSRELDSSS